MSESGSRTCDQLKFRKFPRVRAEEEEELLDYGEDGGEFDDTGEPADAGFEIKPASAPPPAKPTGCTVIPFRLTAATCSQPAPPAKKGQGDKKRTAAAAAAPAPTLANGAGPGTPRQPPVKVPRLTPATPAPAAGSYAPDYVSLSKLAELVKELKKIVETSYAQANADRTKAVKRADHAESQRRHADDFIRSQNSELKDRLDIAEQQRDGAACEADRVIDQAQRLTAQVAFALPPYPPPAPQ